MKPRRQPVIGQDRGFCRICGLEAGLTEDHVPPKRSGNLGPVSISYGSNTVQSSNGMFYKTICARCNNEVLGSRCDPEYNRVMKDAAGYVSNLRMYPFRYLQIKANGELLLRSILGHLLAASIPEHKVEWLSSPTDYSPFYETIRKFVLSEGHLGPNIECFYWLHAEPMTRIVQYFGNAPNVVNSSTDRVFGSTFKSYPVAFWFVDAVSSSIQPTSFARLTEDPVTTLRLDVRQRYHYAFPEIPTQNGMVIYSSNSVVESKKRIARRGPT